MFKTSLNKNQNLYLASVFITYLGNSMSFLAAGKLIYDQVGIAAVFALIIGAEHLQSTLLSYSTGVLVDRFGARRVALYSDVIFAIIGFSMAAAIAAEGLMLLVPIGLVLNNFVKPFYRSSTFALQRHLADEQTAYKLNTQSALFQQIGYFAGLGLTGVFIGQMDMSTILLFDALTFVISAACIAMISIPSESTSQSCSPTSDAEKIRSSAWSRFINEHTEIISFMKENRRAMGNLWIIVIQMLVIDCFNICLFKLVQVRFTQTPSALALIDGGFAAGVIVMSALQTRYDKLRVESHLLKWVFVIQAGFFFFIGSSVNIWLTTVLTVFFAFTVSSVFACSFTELYKVIPKEISGRVGGLRGLMLGTSGLVVTTTIGVGIDTHGLMAGYWCGVLLLGLAVYVLKLSVHPSAASHTNLATTKVS